MPAFRGRIDKTQRVEEGRALCNLSNQAIGLNILEGKRNGQFDNDIIDAAVESIHEWVINNNITHVCCIPTFSQKENIDGVFKIIKGSVPEESKLLLIDDIVDSRWTITVVGALLKNAGANKVFPFCLGKITQYYWTQRERRKNT